MIKRFRVIAGPNGSGKTTLAKRLIDAGINLHLSLNADDFFAVAKSCLRLPIPFSISGDALVRFADASGYDSEVVRFFHEGKIRLEKKAFWFTPDAVNSYTVALVTAFLREEAFRRSLSLTIETVFSHPSKVDAIHRAVADGYRTYLYFVSTDNPAINVLRVESRFRTGGHSVSPDKILNRFSRSLALIRPTIPWLSRAYFFDNSGDSMTLLASYEQGIGLQLNPMAGILPRWFHENVLAVWNR